MILPDVNVFVYAARREYPQHESAARWLTAAVADVEPVAVLDEILASTVRLITNHRIFTTPATTAQAFEFCEAVRAAPSAVTPSLSPRRWSAFAHLCTHLDLRANDVPDALIAADAIALDATLVTFDKGFRRFPGLRLSILDEPNEAG